MKTISISSTLPDAKPFQLFYSAKLLTPHLQHNIEALYLLDITPYLSELYLSRNFGSLPTSISPVRILSAEVCQHRMNDHTTSQSFREQAINPPFQQSPAVPDLERQRWDLAAQHLPISLLYHPGSGMLAHSCAVHLCLRT